MAYRLVKPILLLSLVFSILGGAGYYMIKSWSESPISVAKRTIVDFPTGSSLTQLSGTLEGKKVVSDGLLFYYWVRLIRLYPKFQAGKFLFEGEVTPRQIVDKIVSGKVFREVVIHFTIPEGFRLRQIADRLAAHGIGHINEIRTLLSDQPFIESLGIKAKNLEGYIYPATYSFTDKVSAPTVVKHMVKTFWKNLPKDYVKKAKERGLSLKEAVTFASMIELETKLDEERSLVSEVIWRRLKNRVPLAIDAALIYGIVNYKGDIKWKHLKDKSNPYNTRIHRGLPPTPIGSPGKGSLEAVLTPANKGNYYYVAMVGTDNHHFSKTLKEHNRYVRKLVRASKAAKKKSRKNH